MRIIAADDHGVMRMVLKQIITQELGHELVAIASDGAELIELCRTHKPDLAIIDVIMPPKNGDEAAIALHEQGLVGNIIFATSNAQTPIKEGAKNIGARITIKPYRPDRLKHLIQEIEREQTERRAHRTSGSDNNGNQ